MERAFEAAFQSYFSGCQRITASHYAAQKYQNSTPETWRFDRLQKRIRVVQGSGAHSFVDLETGDVLKAASWKTPAKHARGNIFDEANGLGAMGPYGPAYLR